MQTCLVFFGGVILGTLVGYIIDGIAVLKGWDKVIIAATALVGKEVVELVVKDTPTTIKKFVNKKLGTDGNSTDSK